METTKVNSRLGGDGRIELPQDQSSAKVMLVGPEKAEDWLESNEGNRDLKDDVVRKYARVMESGQWELSNDAICFDKAGYLINGQHRLRAILRSQTTQLFIVARGLEEEAFKWMDQPRKRTLAQALKLEGYQKTNAVAAAARLGYNFEQGHSYRNPVPVRDGVRYVKHHTPHITNSIQAVNDYVSSVKGIWRPSTMRFTHFMLRFHGIRAADDFCKAVATGLGLTEENDPRHQLRSRLQNEAVSEADRINRRIELALTLKAARKWLTGDWVKILKWAPGGNEDFPEPPFADDHPYYFD